MIIAPFFIKVNDLQPYYYAKAKDANGDPVDISGATIKCTMKNTQTGSLHTNQCVSGSNISSGPGGCFEWQWQGSDTATAGKYNIEFEITPASGGKFTFPAKPKERAEVHVVLALDGS